MNFKMKYSKYLVNYRNVCVEHTETMPNPTPVTIPTDAIIETAGSSKDNEKEASCEGPKEKNVRRSKRQELKKKDEKTTCDKCGKEVFEGKKRRSCG